VSFEGVGGVEDGQGHFGGDAEGGDEGDSGCSGNVKMVFPRRQSWLFGSKRLDGRKGRREFSMAHTR
jgi:hypothetical protein